MDTVILISGEGEKMICQECGMEIEGNEYHPHAFCVLVKAGLNPLTVVLEAVGQLATVAPDALPVCDCGVGDATMPHFHAPGFHAGDCAVNLTRQGLCDG